MFSGSTLGGEFSAGFGGSSDIETGFGAIDWSAIINQGFAVGSQAINAFSGKNTGVQVGYNQGSGGIFAIQPSQGGARNFDDGQQYDSRAQAAAYERAAAGGGAAATVGGGVDGIFNWLMANPLITFGGIAGLYLLMKEPPRRR